MRKVFASFFKKKRFLLQTLPFSAYKKVIRDPLKPVFGEITSSGVEAKWLDKALILQRFTPLLLEDVV